MSDEQIKSSWIKCRNDLAGSYPVEVRVGLDELARELRCVDLLELSRKICEDADRCDRTIIRLASALGMDQDMNQLRKDVFQLLSLWIEREGSTVRVINDALLSLHRNDCVDFIENIARYKYVNLCVMLYVTASDTGKLKSIQLKADQVPERLPFRVFARSSIQDYIMSSTSRGLSHSYRVSLKRLGDLDWDSLSRDYVGRQVDLYLDRLTKTKPAAKSKCNTEPPNWLDSMTKEEKRKGYLFEPSRANTIYADLSFDFYDQQLYALVMPQSQSQESQQNETMNIRGRLHSSGEQQDEQDATSPTRTDGEMEGNDNLSDIISLHSQYPQDDELTDFRRTSGNRTTAQADDGLESELLELDLESLSYDKPKENLGAANPTVERVEKKDEGYSTVASMGGVSAAAKPEWHDIQKMPGFHSYSNIREDSRRDMGKKDIQQHFHKHKKHGCYLIRPSQTGPQPFTLTFGYNEKVHNISIVHGEDGKFTLFERPDNAFSSVQDLIEYYKHHDIKDGMRLSVHV